MYVHIYIYIYIYTCIYIYILYLVRHGNRQDVVHGFRRWLFNGFRRGRKRFVMVSVVGFLFFMVSVVAKKNVFVFMVSVAGCLVDSAAAGGSNILERLERFLVCFVFLGLVSVVGCLMVSVTCFMVSVMICSWFPLRFLWFPSLDFWWILPPQEDPAF